MTANRARDVTGFKTKDTTAECWTAPARDVSDGEDVVVEEDEVEVEEEEGRRTRRRVFLCGDLTVTSSSSASEGGEGGSWWGKSLSLIARVGKRRALKSIRWEEE
jgi:hypothetical protein